MAVSLYNIKKWYRMLTGRSILHVNQNIGTEFIPGELKGYFNNMTEKVLKQPELLQDESLPRVTTENGESIFFPVAIFQYGLGAYDLYLATNDLQYYKKFEQCCVWAVQNQLPNGAWDNFSFVFPDYPFGAMCQGEASSLLVRAYKETGNRSYLDSAIKAIDYMITPVENGGTLLVKESDYILLEYMHKAPVLNGWIFALMGLYDVLLIYKDSKFNEIYERSMDTIARHIQRYDKGYWSYYSIDGTIASEFYHKLHIAQMQALFQISANEVFRTYSVKWTNDVNKLSRRIRAFIVKAGQKIIEK